MSLSLQHRAALEAYNLAWTAALPFLYASGRLRQGFGQRLLRGFPRDFHDVWIQAASGGEARLACMLVREILAGEGEKPSILITSCTSQGMEILNGRLPEFAENGAEIETAYFPFDMPRIMEAAVERISPKAVVLLETELWPGLMRACRDLEAPMLVVNGRMTPSSLSGYLLLEGLFRELAPHRILATSEASARRFSLLFGRERVGLMENMKFDSLAVGGEAEEDGLAGVVDKASPFAVFGSIRQEEEPEAMRAVSLLLQAKPGTVIALFPRHMHRIDAWAERLSAAGVQWRFRSRLKKASPPGTVILWDVFGELAEAYGYARAAFVGGSLRPLGGQNFLEPLALGTPAVTGPHYSNFAWAGEELFKQGLVREVDGPEEAADALAKLVARPKDRNTVRKKVAAFASRHSGGTKQAAELVRSLL
jgi:3-deoxy-D-manno-octulosonic-acid transferase